MQERSMLDERVSFVNNQSMEGLERQIMEAVESPKGSGQMIVDGHVGVDEPVKPSEFGFDSRDDSFTA